MDEQVLARRERVRRHVRPRAGVKLRGKPTEQGGGDGDEGAKNGSTDRSKPDTDFDFGDLVTMNAIDVFEVDSDERHPRLRGNPLASTESGAL